VPPTGASSGCAWIPCCAAAPRSDELTEPDLRESQATRESRGLTKRLASIGSNAAHGCIRTLVEDVEKLDDQVPIGSPILIT
jgi:hypothetical protein